MSRLTGIGGERAQHAETWLVRFDLYRAIGQQQKFESLALDYAQQFGWSAPQWYSLPKLVAEAASSDERPDAVAHRRPGRLGLPARRSTPTASRELSSQTLQMPLPWVFDWSALQRIDAEACARLSELFRHWIPQRARHALAGRRPLVRVLQEAAPTGVRDADPAFWQLRLDALRMANRADQFDEAAIDYCVTYEVSPPSWERAVCQVRVSGSSPGNTTCADLASSAKCRRASSSRRSPRTRSRCSPATSTSPASSSATSAPRCRRWTHELGGASVIGVSCARLIRVDFIAAGDLLNWVLAQRNEGRSVSFTDAHRLVALFFGAMGINEHAKITVRQV